MKHSPAIRATLQRGALLLAAAIGTSECAFAATLADAFEHDWYEVEFFVFERTQVMEHNTDERLVLTAPRQLPRNMVAPLPGAEGYEGHYQIDALTRLCLEYPTLDLQFRPDPEEEADNFVTAIDPESESVRDAQVGEFETDLQDQPPAVPEPPDPRELVRADIAAFEEELLASALQWLPQDSLQLSSEARRLERNGTGRILFHGRWRQPVPERSQPSPLLIEAGQSLAPWLPMPELIGTVGVTLGPYLHFQADLFYQAPALNGTPVSIAYDGRGARQELPPTPVSSSGDGYMKLSESRRMRSTEVHYLDHPKLGLVVRIDPIVMPASLIESFDNLEKPL